MLKGINPLLNADVLYILRQMGHGDDLIIVDTNFPAHSFSKSTVHRTPLRIDASAPEVVKAILSLMPLDTFVDDAAARMEIDGKPDKILPVMFEVQEEVSAFNGPNPMQSIERLAFYERAKNAYAIVQTAEVRIYGCFAFRKGIIKPNGE